MDEVHKNAKYDEYEEYNTQYVPRNNQINLSAQEFE